MPILRECVRTGVKGIICFDMGMTLREGSREYFYEALEKNFPGLKERYIERYGDSYEIPSPDSAKLMSLFKNFCRSNSIISDPYETFRYINEIPDKFPQTSLFDM